MKINERNLIAFSTVPPYDCEGFLLKRGEVNKSLQRRYFILKGNLLFYFEKKYDREPLGLVLLEGCTIELSKVYNDSYCFEICFNGNRSYVLCAESEESMNSWMRSLASAGYEYKKLVIAHLQQQLLELEDAQNKRMAKLKPVSCGSRQPPPRHNPFDRTSGEPVRPAPPPPKITSITPTRHSNTSTSSNGQLDFVEQYFPVERSGAEMTGDKNGIQIGVEPRSQDAIVFEQFHEDIRAEIMQDVYEYRQRQQQQYQLIQF